MNSFLQSNKRTRRILVVDDELVNRELLNAILSMNYEVSTASNGAEAMDLLYAAKVPYSLILLDLLMPQMSGFQVIEACKADENLKDIPIMVMTSEKSAEVRSIRMGAADFIAKPYRMPEVILARCERVIEHSEEKALIRSIEADKLTGMYIKVFFDAYIQRLLPNVRGEMDAVMVRIEGVDDPESTEEGRELLKKTAALLNENLMGRKGLGCRTTGCNCSDVFLVFCRHKENYEELFARMRDELGESGGFRLKAGICAKVDKTAESDSWFQKAKIACDSVTDNSLTAVYRE